MIVDLRFVVREEPMGQFTFRKVRILQMRKKVTGDSGSYIEAWVDVPMEDLE